MSQSFLAIRQRHQYSQAEWHTPLSSSENFQNTSCRSQRLFCCHVIKTLSTFLFNMWCLSTLIEIYNLLNPETSPCSSGKRSADSSRARPADLLVRTHLWPTGYCRDLLSRIVEDVEVYITSPSDELRGESGEHDGSIVA